MPLYRVLELKEFLAKHNLHAKKGFSQNFLIDGNVLDKIVTAAKIEKNDTVLEIGPGPGALTEALLQRNAQVVAIEKDTSFAQLLPRLSEDAPDRLIVHNEDALHCSLDKLVPQNTKVVANLPYQITAPLLGKLLPLYPLLQSVTVMVQKEVAERITATPGTKTFGHFSLFCQCFATLSYCFTVKNSCFLPAPKVDSAVVHCQLKPPPTKAIEEFLQFSRIAFQHKRKTLKANLKFFYEKEMVDAFFEKENLAPTIRAEEIPLEDLLLLWEKIHKG
jgi:16S rRNA (adenine1518-N6/adenine1519-N6)-dimethyltransferase